MATSREQLARWSIHVGESLGIRPSGEMRSTLSPIPLAQDTGRRPVRGYGKLSLEQLIPDPDQPRVEFDAEAETRLAENLQAKGQLHPLHVRWSEADQKWMIIAGERRWRAARRAGLATVDCYFHEEALSTAQVLELQLIENLLRDNLRPLEMARAFQALLELNQWNAKQLADALSLPASTISRSLALLKLPSPLQAEVDAGTVSARSGYELSKISQPERQQQLANQAAAGELTHTDLRRMAKRQGKPERSATVRTFFAEGGWKIGITAPPGSTYAQMEQALAQVLEEVRLRMANNIRL